MRVGPGLGFVLDVKGELLLSTLTGANRLDPGAGLSSQAGVQPFILGMFIFFFFCSGKAMMDGRQKRVL